MKCTSLRNLVFLIIEDLCIFMHAMVHDILHNVRNCIWSGPIKRKQHF